MDRGARVYRLRRCRNDLGESLLRDKKTGCLGAGRGKGDLGQGTRPTLVSPG